MTVRSSWWFARGRGHPEVLSSVWRNEPEIVELKASNRPSLVAARCAECRRPIAAVYRTNRRRLVLLTTDQLPAVWPHPDHGREVRFDAGVFEAFIVTSEALTPMRKAIDPLDRPPRLTCSLHGSRRCEVGEVLGWLKAGKQEYVIDPTFTWPYESRYS